MSFVEANVTNDDFDSVVTYNDLTLFTTPDPSNKTTASEYAQYFDGTYHATSITNASLTYTFQGTDLYIYGAAGPSYGSYRVDLDGNATTQSSYNTENATLPYLIYQAHGLSNSSQHTFSMTNLGSVNSGEGSSMLLDFLQTTVQLAPIGATLMKNTVEDLNTTALTYTGTWSNNSDPLFSGGTTSYTNEDGGSVSMSFYGTAVFLYGDQNNDHGFFNITLDGQTMQYRTPNGCGGRFGKFCEKTNPGVQFWAAYLGPEEHNLTITNIRKDENVTYFDLDRIVYTTPSTYLAGIPTTIQGSASSTTGSLGGSVSGASATVSGYMPLYFLGILCSLLLARWL